MSCEVLPVLLWKHYVVRKRRFIHSILEFVSPAILFLMFCAIWSKFDNNIEKYHTHEQFTEEASGVSLNYIRQIYFWPPSEKAVELINVAGKQLNLVYKGQLPKNESIERLRGMWSCDNESEFNTIIENVRTLKIAGVMFKNLDHTAWVNNLEYTIRLNRDFSTHDYRTFPGYHENFGDDYNDFVALQWAIDTSYIQLRSNITVTQKLMMQHFPKPRSQAENINGLYLGWFLLVISFLSPLMVFLFQVTRLVQERYSGIQELIKMCGVHHLYITSAHMFNCGPAWLVYIIAGTVTATFLPDGSYLAVPLVLVLYFAYVIILAFTCSLLLSKPNEAVTLSLTIYSVTFSLGVYVARNVNNHREFLLVLSGLLPHAPLVWFWQHIGATIKYGRGLIWGGIASTVDPYSGSPCLCLLMLAVQVVLLALFTEYLLLLRPGKYGVARPWNFLFHRGERVEPHVASGCPEEEDPVNRQRSSDYFQHADTGTAVGICIKHVSKVFGNWGRPKTLALHDVSLDIYAGEITVLLGHNGAGKTTLMNIITGMYSPTRGKIFIQGQDVFFNNTRVRKNIGLCPQHNLVFEDLTVEEHIRFFAMLKGVKATKAKSSAEGLLRQMRLSSKASCMSGALSGGMKRRLQLGCALAGDPCVLVLDEPTSGLDIETRRELWNLILALRGDRTVLLTTHFMEEADALGDRVAALHTGQLRCHATPMYLKRAIGEGYRLSLNLESGYDRVSVKNTVTGSVPDARLEEATPTGVTFALPAKDTQKFPILFKRLEEQKQQIGVKNMCLGRSTLEEVFLRLCSDRPAEYALDEAAEAAEGERLPQEQAEGKVCKKLSGPRLRLQQFTALLGRQIKYFRSKNVLVRFMEIGFPMLCIISVAYSLNGDISEQEDFNPPRALNLDVYNDFGSSIIFNSIQLQNGDSLLEPFESKYSNFEFRHTDDVIEAILSEGNAGMSDYNRLLLALELNATTANALYTTTVRHALPVCVNVLTNLLALRHLGWTNLTDTITTVNHPIYEARPSNMRTDLKLPKNLFVCFVWAFAIATFCTFLISPMVKISIVERLSGTRHLYIMTGVPCTVYFAAMYLFHFTIYVVCTLPTVGLAAGLLDYDSTFNNGSFIGAVFVLLTVYGLAFLSFLYMLSYFTSEGVASAIVSVIAIVFAIVLPVVHKTTADLDWYWHAVTGTAAVMPTYDVSYGLAKLASAARLNALCALNRQHCPDALQELDGNGFNHTECCNSHSPNGYINYFSFSLDSALVEVFVMILQTIVFWTLTLMLERGVLNRWWDVCLNRGYRAPPLNYREPQAQAERLYVDKEKQSERSTKFGPDAALVDNLHKQYRSAWGRAHLAVRGVSFTVKRGECFGLLGVNGAGKSTVFKMLTGSEHPTRGQSYANGYSLARQRDKYLSTLTYCPQFGGMDEFLSGWDNVELMVRLRGVVGTSVQEEVRSWIEYVDLLKESRRATREYSGGCARRCLTAVALAGAGGLALLDEPTAGVDPGARRKVWSALRHSLRHGISLVISSHSMDETEALCNRIAIMSRGEVGALGSAGDLRAAHARGYSAQLKLRVQTSEPAATSHDGVDGECETDGASYSAPATEQELNEISEIKKAVKDRFTCVLKDEHKSMLHYHIADDISYGALFESMESLRRLFPGVLEDYTISGTTLEEVFLSFAKDATSEDSTDTYV